jgi:hypothetical protein
MRSPEIVLFPEFTEVHQEHLERQVQRYRQQLPPDDPVRSHPLSLGLALRVPVLTFPHKDSLGFDHHLHLIHQASTDQNGDRLCQVYHP